MDEGSLDHVEKPAPNADRLGDFDFDFDAALAKHNLNDEEMADAKKQISEMLFPEPVPGFKRSIALQLQIKVLRENLDAHYMVAAKS